MGPLRVERDGPLAVLTIDSPPLNLWDATTGPAFTGALDSLDADPPRGLLIRAEGRVFTGGVDVHVFAGRDRETGAAMAREVLSVAGRVAALPYPTVLAAHGLCLTWGFELALACDLLLAAEPVKFALVEHIVGLSPFMGGPQRLALRVGPARAKEFVMTGDRYDAATLHNWGVVNRVLPVEGFDAATREFALRLANGPTRAHAVTKRLVDLACSEGEPAATAITPALAGELFETADNRNAVASFLRDGPGKATHTGR
ncbi:enoyl-CoA hydratase/isomerase family protein [Sporichthya sp.]|uniref:enoyl-CoA hydratase/isomerase family protein n=1 Tax=Sporichthya sp. TaxID=65475 RepID=UPI00185386DF|nr:enoyl-CoA hydratase/isomerase family protein [Sporichthya sp.]MBA3742838.1 enoyl-CoA hydratase/isomerase family protein [Sporichthya sp.]